MLPPLNFCDASSFHLFGSVFWWQPKIFFEGKICKRTCSLREIYFERKTSFDGKLSFSGNPLEGSRSGRGNFLLKTKMLSKKRCVDGNHS